jgi:serine/threonine protein kinase
MLAQPGELFMPDQLIPADKIPALLPAVSEASLLDGSGGFKAVYRASIHGSQQALKIIRIVTPPGLSPEEASAFRAESVGRVRREVDVLKNYVQPEVVKLGSQALAEVKFDEELYLAYSEELIPGHDLWHEVCRGGPFPSEGEVRILFVNLLKAVRGLWSMGYVHRDIKPKNVMKTGDPGRPFVLLDLGIAYSVMESALTFNPGNRMPLATYRYLAPELMDPRFRESITYRSDLYTTAMTVYEYASRRHPLAEDQGDMMRTITRALHLPATPLATHRPDLTSELCLLVDQMLKKKPALRPANLNQIITMMESKS